MFNIYLDMGKDINKVIKSFNLILKENRALVDEVASTSGTIFGGSGVRIPAAGAHAGQSGWQSSNAWDIQARVGTPVYAIADGVAETFNDYGRQITKTQEKKLYGQSFTVKSSKGLPDVYYTHLEKSPIRKGSNIKCGQFIGYVMDMPDSDYDHVHIGVSKGDISQFLTPDGKLRCGGGTITASGGTPTQTTNDTESDSDYGKIIDFAQPSLQESFGKNISQKYGTITIPAKDNPTIYSPSSGEIVSPRYGRSCKNEIFLELKGKKGYIQFCNISNPKVVVGDKVSKGSVIGKTSEDVEVVYMDRSFNRKNIKKDDFSVDMEKEDDKIKKKSSETNEPTYYDPALAFIPSMISSMFKDKIDKEGNVEKRMGYATDKKPVDPWIVNSVSKPFKKLGNFLGTNKEKKVQENIERIKKLL